MPALFVATRPVAAMLGDPVKAKVPDTPLATLTALDVAPEPSAKLCGVDGIPVYDTFTQLDALLE